MPLASDKLTASTPMLYQNDESELLKMIFTYGSSEAFEAPMPVTLEGWIDMVQVSRTGSHYVAGRKCLRHAVP